MSRECHKVECEKHNKDEPFCEEVYCIENTRGLEPHQPCSHPGCLSHQTHPCEGCGRIGGYIIPEVGKKYRHKKGGLYTVIGFARYSETEEDLVLYQQVMHTENNTSIVWARPYGMFRDGRFVEYE